MKKVDLSYNQQVSRDEILNFLFNKLDPCFTLSGVAGSGKSTITKELISYLAKYNTRMAYLTLIGRALSTMKNVKDVHVSTIHRFLYKAEFDETLDRIVFKKRDPKILKTFYDFIIVDEASLVNSAIFTDLTNLGVPILFVGDKEQLPPISNDKDGFNIMDVANVHLTEIHRQAENNPIIKLSRDILETGTFKRPQLYDPNFVRFINKNSITKNYFGQTNHDIILCGSNKLRRRLNRTYRAYKGFRGEHAVKGETVICLRNSIADGIPVYNGERFQVESITYNDKNYSIYKLDGNVEARIKHDSWAEVEPDFRSCFLYFTYGYAMTTWKAQGSEFDDVLFVDEEVSHITDLQKFRYTAVTRAKNKITIGR